MLVPGAIEARRVAGRVLGPQRLVLALHVVGDDPGRQREDRLRRAIVLLEAHDLGARIVVLEVEDVADVGAPPLVDRLVAVADDAHVAMLGGEQPDDAVLRAVRVLVLVDEHVAPEAAVVGEDVRNLGEEADHQQQQVVEVDGARLAQPLLVARVDERRFLLPRPPRVAQRLGHGDHLVLEVRDAVHGGARRERAVGQLTLLQAVLHERQAIVLVVDREVRRQAQVRAVLAQDPHAPRMERGDQRRLEPDRRQQAVDPSRHLAGGLVGERHGEQVARREIAATEQPGDPVGDHARLAAAGAGQHEQRTVAGRHGFALGGIQIVEETLHRCCHHAIVPDRVKLRAAGQIVTAVLAPGQQRSLTFRAFRPAASVAYRLPPRTAP